MSGWKSANIKEFVEVKIKIPKNTIAFIVNYLEQCGNGSINMGNTSYDQNDVALLMKKGDDDNGAK